MSSDTTAAEPTRAPGTGHEALTFLVGDHVYLRTIEKEDAAHSMAWRQSTVPIGESATESWIDDDLKDERDTLWLVIVRKSDDRPVGSMKREIWGHQSWITGFSDPLLGETGDRYLGEAYQVFIRWTVDEQHRVLTKLDGIPADKPILHEMLREIGCEETSVFHRRIRRGQNFIDCSFYEYYNRDWLKTLGHPNDVALERTGTGEARPVIAPVSVTGELPKQAIRVGPRVYIRPLQKADAKVMTELVRKDNDPFWSSGRSVYTTTGIESYWTKGQSDEPRDTVYFAVCTRDADEFIGIVGVDGIDYVNRYAESVSEFYNTEFRARGFGTEAKHLMFDYAFNTLNLESIQSWVLYTNTRSAAALRKQGYVECGRESWLVRKRGDFENFGTYELLAERWRSLPRTETPEEAQ